MGSGSVKWIVVREYGGAYMHSADHRFYISGRKTDRYVLADGNRIAFTSTDLGECQKRAEELANESGNHASTA